MADSSSGEREREREEVFLVWLYGGRIVSESVRNELNDKSESTLDLDLPVKGCHLYIIIMFLSFLYLFSWKKFKQNY